LDPIDSILAWIEFWAPWPIEIIAITEAMPMTIPKTVRPDRTLFAVIAEYIS